ncbi:hypothetical protein ACVWZ8_000159 [Arthrobacter sp. UYCu723]
MGVHLAGIGGGKLRRELRNTVCGKIAEAVVGTAVGVVLLFQCREVTDGALAAVVLNDPHVGGEIPMVLGSGPLALKDVGGGTMVGVPGDIPLGVFVEYLFRAVSGDPGQPAGELLADRH